MPTQTLGERMKARRESLGLSQKEIATALKLHPTKISLMETGKRRIHPTKHMPVLTKLLQVPINWFYEDVDVRKEPAPLESLLNQYFPNETFSKTQINLIDEYLLATLPILVKAIKQKPKKDNK